MTDPIFCRTRHTYDSYVDFWLVVELSGFPCIYVDEIEPDSDNVYIFTPLNGENHNGWQDPRAEIILWDLEWRLEGLPVDYMGTNAPGINVPGVERIWASDRWYAKAIGAEYVPLGSHAGLASGYTENANGFVYDAAVMAYLGPHRRNNMVNRLRDSGVTIAPNGWGQERHDILRASKAMLHIHQWEGIQTIAPQRWALAAAYGLPLLSEMVIDGGIFSDNYVMYASYEYLAHFVPRKLLKRGDEFDSVNGSILENYGRELHQLLCVERTFRVNVEAAV